MSHLLLEEAFDSQEAKTDATQAFSTRSGGNPTGCSAGGGSGVTQLGALAPPLLDPAAPPAGQADPLVALGATAPSTRRRGADPAARPALSTPAVAVVVNTSNPPLPHRGPRDIIPGPDLFKPGTCPCGPPALEFSVHGLLFNLTKQ
jgi:hypothetical protein